MDAVTLMRSINVTDMFVEELDKAMLLLGNKRPDLIINQSLNQARDWENIHPGVLSGFYGQNHQPHPCQDQSFPFLYDPSLDEYIGFRWDYGDTSPLVPELTTEVIQSLSGLFLSPKPTDYYCAHGTWDARFTVVCFKKPRFYPAMFGSVKSSKLLKQAPYDVEKERLGNYFPYELHPGAEPLRSVGYEAILTPADLQSPAELFLFNPKFQVTRTMWTEWKR